MDRQDEYLLTLTIFKNLLVELELETCIDDVLDAGLFLRKKNLKLNSTTCCLTMCCSTRFWRLSITTSSVSVVVLNDLPVFLFTFRSVL